MYFYDKRFPSLKFLISSDLWKSLSVHLLLHFVSLIPGNLMILFCGYYDANHFRRGPADGENASEMTSLFPFQFVCKQNTFEDLRE